MFSQFLARVLTDSTLRGGCGMSTRPAFYSGRGATSSDLSSEKLERIYKAIIVNVSMKAADAFALMVANLPCLSATDFLLALARLEGAEWVWRTSMVGSENGRYADSFGAAMGTVLETVSGRKTDETVSIRRQFLNNHGIKDPKAGQDKYGYGW